jgi:3-carboxy-cis,cis-muconate cycloisomerase
MLDALLRDPEIEALVDDAALLRAMVAVELALARVQARLGLIDAASAGRMQTALAGFAADPAAIAQGLRRSAVPVPALLAALRERLGPELAAGLHVGATSQDIVDTALVLQLRSALDLLESRLRQVMVALIALAEAHEATVMVARTRFQPALPTTFGLKVAGWLAPLSRHLGRLAELRPRLLAVQLGGAAGTLAALGDSGLEVMRALAAELDLGCPPAPWHNARDSMVELSAWLALVTGSLGKLGGDVLLLGQGEIGEVHEAAGGGSSTLPQKSNPIRAEALVTLARHNATALAGMAQAQLHLHERDGSAWQLEWLTLPDMLTGTGASLTLAEALLAGLDVDRARMRLNMDAGNGLILAEGLTFALARHMPRADAERLVRDACHAALGERRHLVDVLRERVDLPLAWDALAEPAGHLGAAPALQARIIEAARAALSAARISPDAG